MRIRLKGEIRYTPRVDGRRQQEILVPAGIYHAGRSGDDLTIQLVQLQQKIGAWRVPLHPDEYDILIPGAPVPRETATM